jgi:23S rRNA pseudouridine1911/1915/1917 synthase
MITYEYQVKDEDARKRLDHFLMGQGVPFSRSQVQKWVEQGAVTVNGRPSRVAGRLKAGDRVVLVPEEPAPLGLTPEDIPLSVLFEDKDLLVLDKPAGLVVHPAPGNYKGTLVQALLHHCRDLSGIGGVLRPGIVHRLDKDTSGLMVVAKNDFSHQALVKAFQTGQVRKEYQALIWGHPQLRAGVIEKPIGRHPVQRKKMAVNERQGKPALTEWEVVEKLPLGLALLRLFLKTGRTHQIRVHLASLGWPILGDPVYGPKKRSVKSGDQAMAILLKDVSRQLLHACRLSFNHPVSGKNLSFYSSLPREMEKVIQALRNRAELSSA